MWSVVGAVPAPPRRPVIGGMFVAPNGTIAVIRQDLDPNPVRAGDSVYVDILEADGSVRGNAVLPPGRVLHAFTGEHLITVWRDTTQVAGRSTGRSAFPMPLHQIIRYRVDPPKRP